MTSTAWESPALLGGAWAELVKLPAGRVTALPWYRSVLLAGGLQPLVHDSAGLSTDRHFIVPMAAWADDAWARTDETLVLVGPFDPLDIPCTGLHFYGSFAPPSTSMLAPVM